MYSALHCTSQRCRHDGRLLFSYCFVSDARGLQHVFIVVVVGILYAVGFACVLLVRSASLGGGHGGRRRSTITAIAGVVGLLLRHGLPLVSPACAPHSMCVLQSCVAPPWNP